MGMLDIFKTDAFGVVSLTDTINRAPYVPGRLGQLLDWNEQGVTTVGIAIEEYQGALRLLNPQPRGASGEAIAKPSRKIRDLRIPHYEVNDAVMAEEVQGVRSFGSETELETVAGKITQRMNEHVMLRFDPTLEYQRIGAIKGIILNGDGSTLYNLFTEFNVTQPTEIAFDLANASPASGVLRTRCTAVLRAIMVELGATPLLGVGGMCGDAFWDALVAHPEFRASYLNQTEAFRLRESVTYQSVDFGGIRFENYRGAVGGTPFIATDKCNFFPIGSPGLFRTVFAPGDLVETVNTVGRPRYASMYPMDNGKGMHLDMQMNALSYCTRPRALVQGRQLA
jgi:hypothetical protein